MRFRSGQLFCHSVWVSVAAMFLLMVSATSAGAQELGLLHHPRQSDIITVQQIDGFDIGDNGYGVTWDLSQCEIKDEGCSVRYLKSERTDSVIGLENNTLHGYLAKDRMLFLSGYENRDMAACYETPMALLPESLMYGSRAEGTYSGSMAYGERLFFREYGAYSVECDATGRLVVPSEDTLHNVFRIHTTLITVEESLSGISTMSELGDYLAEHPMSADSIRCKLSSDTMLVWTDVYKWYATGYRYPIVRSTMMRRGGMSPYLKETVCCLPEMQCLQDDDANLVLRSLLSPDSQLTSNPQDMGRKGQGDGKTGTGVNGIGNVKVVADASNGSILIEFDMAPKANAEIYLCDITGIRHRKMSCESPEDGKARVEISSAGLKKGQYVIVLTAGGFAESKVITL